MSFERSSDWDNILDMIGAREAWQHNKGENAVIGVIDSGMDMSRLDSSQALGVWSQESKSMYDEVGHGTMVTLSMVSKAQINGFEGVASEAKVIILKPSPSSQKNNGYSRLDASHRLHDYLCSGD